MSLELQIINIPEGELLAENSFSIPPAGGVLGRATDNLVSLPDSSRFLSGQHARIFQAEGDWLIEDTSTNGLVINSAKTPLGAGRKQTLSDGDILTLGDYRILVNLFSPEVSLNPLGEPEDIMDFSNDFLVADRPLNADKKSLELSDPFLESGDAAEINPLGSKHFYEPAIEKNATSQNIADVDASSAENPSGRVHRHDEQLINVFNEVPESIPDRAEESPLEPLTELKPVSRNTEHQSHAEVTRAAEPAYTTDAIHIADEIQITDIVSVHSEALSPEKLSHPETLPHPPVIDVLYQLREENEKLKSLLRKRERQKNRQVQHCMTEALEQTLMDFAPGYLEKLFDDYSSGSSGFFSRRDNWKLYEKHFQRMMKEQTPKLSFMARYHAAMHKLQEKGQ
ncbi:hypothetical protein EOPP23_06685 [Endozoicomonas sp. OPT23]|uniref:FHA domain-containing protein n=1 Tax=Endozoicomonas sp. OPT23 TaxID=2072845 RepID=UPI00129AF98D|nr:FHA domain-containing protein [Endozoicomonas sp. OPT23]MRI32673.1 hypothetical protein [Endozoicomonas sp. OPT23]